MFPYDHLKGGGGGEVFDREKVIDCGGEDTVTPEGIDCMTSLKMLDPCQDENGKLCHGEVACPRGVEFQEVSVPCSGE